MTENSKEMPHPLEITGPPPAKKQKYLQPRFPQIGPAGDGPRVIMAAQSGMGKTSATSVFFKEYLRIVDRVHLVSGTIHLDPAYKEMKRMVEEKYKAEGISLEDPEENPFHEDLKALPTILAGMVERTRQAQQNGDKYMPLTFVILDDLMANSGTGGYQYNNDILKLMSTSRHSGGVVVTNTQSYKQLAKAARLQATHLGVWAVQQTQWDEIRAELAGRQGMSREDLEVAWQTATRQPHGFLWLAYNAPVGSKMWSGFTKKLILK